MRSSFETPGIGASCWRRPTRTSLPLNFTSASEGTESFLGGGGARTTGGGAGSDEAHPRARSAAESARFTPAILSTEEARVTRALGELPVPQNPHLFAPPLELGRRPQSQQLPHR